MQPERDRLHELFSFLNTHEELESVFVYLKNTYPNTDKENEQERVNRVVSVRGGFPKLPPNYVTRKSLVSTKFFFIYIYSEYGLMIHQIAMLFFDSWYVTFY